MTDCSSLCPKLYIYSFPWIPPDFTTFIYDIYHTNYESKSNIISLLLCHPRKESPSIKFASQNVLFHQKSHQLHQTKATSHPVRFLSKVSTMESATTVLS